MAESERRQAYWARINRALDYIEAHLHEPLTLEEIARSAFFSPFHFHRIFSALMGEPVSQFVQRLRLEKAAFLLRAHPRRSVTRVALDCGYGNHAAFSRAFRSAFGLSPTAWRRECPKESKEGTAAGKTGKAAATPGRHSSGEGSRPTDTHPRRDPMKQPLEMDVRIEEIPETTLAYVRHVGPYAGDSELFSRLFGRLFQWAGPRNLIRFPDTQMLSIYHDDPHVTDPDKLRLSVGITVPADTAVSGDVGKMSIGPGRYAQARFEILPDQYETAWNAVYGAWLPESGFEPADGLSFERYLNNPEEHPEGKHVVEICVPVKPL